MPANISPDGKRIDLTHKNGASAEILLFGATVISWKSKDNKNITEPVERLFLSSKSALDGTKAVRGGIPVVFPFFGPPTRDEHKDIPQHGFARVETWKWDGLAIMDNEAGVSVRLTLTPSATLTHGSVSLAYVVTLAEHQLSTDLHVSNGSSSSSPVEFQALLHTYIRAPSKDVTVHGLNGLHYTDKTEPLVPRKQEERLVVDVKRFTDSVYENGPREYHLQWPGNGIRIKAIGMKDVVVWNPNRDAGRKMGDMEDGGWDQFICIEPGFVVGWATVQPGETWIGGQILSVEN